MRLISCLTALLLLWGNAASGADSRRTPRRLIGKDLLGPVYAATLSNITVTPSTISFALTDPDTNPSVAGNATATLTWSITQAPDNRQTWTLTAQAPSASFSGCATVP